MDEVDPSGSSVCQNAIPIVQAQHTHSRTYASKTDGVGPRRPIGKQVTFDEVHMKCFI